MQDFIFENPTRIIFGKGSISQIGQEVKRFGGKVLMVCGKESIKKNGIYNQVLESLGAQGLTVSECSGVKSNPVLSFAYRGIDFARREKMDVVLAVGGGSVIDTAKVIAAGVKTDGDIWDCFEHGVPISGALPILTVLTVAASASEMNPIAVITNERTMQKLSARSPFMQPRVSVMDPSVLFTLGADYTAYSAVDTISHMLEGYFNNTELDSRLQDRLMEGLIRTVMENVEIALKFPENYNARANLMWAATLALNGLTTAGMGQTSLPAHMISYSLSTMFDIPHGASLSILLPAWMRYAMRRDPTKYARLARKLFAIDMPDDAEAADQGVERLRNWMASLGCPISLKQCGIHEQDLEGIIANAVRKAEIKKAKEYTPAVLSEIISASK